MVRTDGDDFFIPLCVFGAFVILLSGIVGCTIGLTLENSRWKQKLIERDLAEYDSNTGEWQWGERKHIREEQIDGDL